MSRSSRVDVGALLALALLASVAAYLWFRDLGTILGYKDALSHLLIGRRVVVGQHPGFGQLGGIWLPLPHLLISTLAWNGDLYTSGLAGSVFSMLAYVATVLGLYGAVRVATRDRLAGWVAAAVYGLNPNALYLQSTPMGETLMYAGIVTAVLMMLLWYRTGLHRYLMLAAVCCMLLVLVRYEAWVFSLALLLVVVHVCFVKGHPFFSGDFSGQAYVLVFTGYAALGVLLWLIWDLVIFGDPLAWLTGQYTSIDQTRDLELSQVADLRVSLQTYAFAIRDTIGLPLALCGAAGMVAMAWRERLSPVFTTFLATAAAGAFITYGLYSGAQPMRVTEIDGDLYNLRMAVVMLLPIALFTGYAVSLVPRTGRVLSSALRIAGAAVLVVLAGAGLASASASDGRSVITSLEASQAYAAYQQERRVGDFVEDHTTGRVLIESFANEWVVFPNQERVIYEGSDQTWKIALKDPADPRADIDVIVMRTTEGNTDAVEKNLNHRPVLTTHFRRVLKTDDFEVWQRKDGAP
ncbi:MAG: hypothetical protein H6529_18050 [Nocardioides sp.]|nr:hypothetical protein [Nocardioides sp.]